jgi:hypothetical protein
MSENTLFNLKPKRIEIEPKYCVAAINPRDLSDLQGITLMPDIVATHGHITTPIVVWRPIDADGNFDQNHPIWDSVHDTLTNEPLTIPKEERSKYRILVCGHRREWCASTVLANPSVYSAEMVKNLSKLPANEISCSQEAAEKVALDFETSEPLHSWNTVKLVLGLMAKDVQYQDIALRMPRLLFTALLTNGAAKYNKLVREASNGAERVREIKSALRNRLDTHITSCHLFGPAMAKQLVLHFRYAENQLADVGDKDSLVMNLKYENVRELRQLYNKIKDDGSMWTPITRVAIEETAPKEDPEVSFRPTPGGKDSKFAGKFFVVEGGNADFREAVLKLMLVYQKPEAAEEKVKPPTATERQAILTSTNSGIGKAFGQYFNASATEETPGKFLKVPRSRVQWEEWAVWSESIQAKMLEMVETSEPIVKELLISLTNQAAPKAAAERVASIIATLNEFVKASTTTKSKK